MPTEKLEIIPNRSELEKLAVAHLLIMWKTPTYGARFPEGTYYTTDLKTWNFVPSIDALKTNYRWYSTPPLNPGHNMVISKLGE